MLSTSNKYGIKKQIEYRLREIDETKKYFLEEVKYDYWVSKKHKKVSKVLNCIEHLLILLLNILLVVFQLLVLLY